MKTWRVERHQREVKPFLTNRALGRLYLLLNFIHKLIVVEYRANKHKKIQLMIIYNIIRDVRPRGLASVESKNLTSAFLVLASASWVSAQAS